MSASTNTTDKEGLIKKLFELGAHFGYSKSRSHPSVKHFIYGWKNRQAVIDLEKTVSGLEKAKGFLKTLGSEGKTILLVGNKDEARSIVAKAAESLGMPYVNSRWLGGTFTNFAQIRSRINRLTELKDKREKGELAKYTKKERLLIDREIEDLERFFATLTGLDKLPAAVVVVDSEHEKIAITEAQKVRVPVVSISNSDCDVRGIAYPIIANDGSTAAVKFLVQELVEAYEAGRAEPVKSETAPAASTEAAVA